MDGIYQIVFILRVWSIFLNNGYIFLRIRFVEQGWVMH